MIVNTNAQLCDVNVNPTRWSMLSRASALEGPEWSPVLPEPTCLCWNCTLTQPACPPSPRTSHHVNQLDVGRVTGEVMEQGSDGHGASTDEGLQGNDEPPNEVIRLTRRPRVNALVGATALSPPLLSESKSSTSA